MPAPHIRLATVADLAAINAIYNHYVHTSTCTYQLDPTTDEERRAAFDARGAAHPATVAELDGVVVGWGSLSPFRARGGYASTVENAVYVRHDLHRRGIGAALLRDQIERATAIGHHTIVAVIDAEQTGSLELHRRAGFVHAGTLREAGRKFDRWLDAVFLQWIRPQSP
jgi:L-amino acid N-acyltransferase YncA